MLLEEWLSKVIVKCLENIVEMYVLSTHPIQHWISYSKLKAIFYWRWLTSLDNKELRTSVDQQKTQSKVCQLQTLIEEWSLGIEEGQPKRQTILSKTKQTIFYSAQKSFGRDLITITKVGEAFAVKCNNQEVTQLEMLPIWSQHRTGQKVKNRGEVLYQIPVDISFKLLSQVWTCCLLKYLKENQQQER